MDDVVSRLHRTLVDALRDRGHDLDGRPVTVAEIYQELVPYRAVRDRLGVELNADYEHALLRLLAGEGGRVRLEPATAREELQAELESPDPYVGVYRKFAACDAWIVDGAGDGPRAAATWPAAPRAEVVPGAIPPAPRAGGSADDAAASPGAVDEPLPSRAGVVAMCSFCREPLPEGRTVRFCPDCGMDQRRRPCAGCGEVLEPAWRFCIACGVPVDPTLRAP